MNFSTSAWVPSTTVSPVQQIAVTFSVLNLDSAFWKSETESLLSSVTSIWISLNNPILYNLVSVFNLLDGIL